MNFVVYLLINTYSKYTYLGVTNNSEKRIRQHNGEIKGGAKYTRAMKKNGTWKYYMKISNLTKNESYSLESTVKKTKIKGIGNTPLEKKNYLLLFFSRKYPLCEINYFN